MAVVVMWAFFKCDWNGGIHCYQKNRYLLFVYCSRILEEFSEIGSFVKEITTSGNVGEETQ